MSFTIVTDSTANLNLSQMAAHQITVIPFPFFKNGEKCDCPDIDTYDDKAFCAEIRSGVTVTTSLISPGQYMETMEPILADGKDILFVGLSSGISGSFASAKIAKTTLLEKYPDRKIGLVDSLAASMGEGLLVLHAARCRAEGMTLEQTVEALSKIREKIYQVFIVDDLGHLKRTGRLSRASAIVGTVLGIKPLLKGNEEGMIVPVQKVRGRKQAIDALAAKYEALVKDPESQTVAISYSGCHADAEYLAQCVRRKFPPREILICKHEPATGSHLGPDSLALYFEGAPDVRYH